MAKYIINGGNPLKGQIKLFGAKNSSFKVMLAALLADETSTISNICFIRDVIAVKDLVKSLGGQADFGNEKTLHISGKGLSNYQVPLEFGEKSRASTMILPILLHRFQKAVVPLPGGDNIGTRSLDRHVEGLETLGVEIKLQGGFIHASTPKGLTGGEYTFRKNTHTGTETLIMAAVLAQGKTILKNAAEEPEIDDLINLLNRMGGNVKRTGYRQITIEGVTSLHGGDLELMADRNEAVTFACMALATNGDVIVEGAQENNLKIFLSKVEAAGGGYEVVEGGIRFFSKGGLKGTNMETAFYPGFMTDWQAFWTTLMTQAQGVSIIHERVFENRFAYVDFLKKMGAKIELFNPEIDNPESFYEFNWEDQSETAFHAARVYGPNSLEGSELHVSDIRAGATLTLAALVAQGESVIDNIELIERGYENLEGRLQSLGANIVRKD